VGDLVEIDSSKKVIGKVFPRKNRLIRPAIANVDQVVAVMSVLKPPLDLFFLDRILVSAEASFLDIVICFNKMDLATKNDEELVRGIKETFVNCGYRVILSSTVKEQGVEELRKILQGKITVFSGPSGVGKSTLINRLKPELKLFSKPVSAKTERGRHTTRHVELLGLDKAAFVADTPGFQRLDLKNISSTELHSFFPEMISRGPCRFRSCLHNTEPGCVVKDAVLKGEIASWRYEHYLAFLMEIQQREKMFFPKKGENSK
jgi:ribosome biogenesis GTPase